mgnify:CR=1 FL=1
MRVHDISSHERVEMYLKAVFTIQAQDAPVTISRVAESMDVSAPSAHGMLKRLRASGMVRAVDEGYRLTAAGRARAARVVRRLRLAECLLTDVLHLELSKVYDEACKMEHVISDEVEARLAEVLGQPSRCPHGLPIPGARGDAVEPGVPLDTLADGQRAHILAVPEEETPVVTYLWELGVRPGMEVEVRQVAPFDGPVILRIAEREQALGRRVAGRVRVQPL